MPNWKIDYFATLEDADNGKPMDSEVFKGDADVIALYASTVKAEIGAKAYHVKRV